MALKSTSDQYGTVAVSIHWVSAVLVLILIGSGFRAANTTDLAAKTTILRVHVPIAIGVLALMLLRIVWWWGFDRKPGPVAGIPPVLRRHPRNDSERHRNDRAERRSAIDLWRRKRAAARFLEISAPATTRHRSAGSRGFARAPRGCRSLPPFCSPRWPAVAHVVQHVTSRGNKHD